MRSGLRRSLPKGLSQWLWISALVGALTACGTVPKGEPGEGALESATGLSLAMFDQWVGRYASPNPDRLRLEIETEPAPVPNQRIFIWTQRVGGGESPTPGVRQFVIQVALVDGALTSTFAPLNRSTRTDRGCPLRWQMAQDNDGQPTLLGQTDPASCQFGPPQARMSLLKEIAFDGERIRVADRLIDSESTGPGASPAQVTEFVATQRYAGTLGVRENNEWRVSEPIALDSDGQRRPVSDAAGMPLGLAVGLERRYIGDQLKLRMVISDAQGDRVLGQAWADADALSIGWSSPTVQAAFRREGQ